MTSQGSAFIRALLRRRLVIYLVGGQEKKRFERKSCFGPRAAFFARIIFGASERDSSSGSFFFRSAPREKSSTKSVHQSVSAAAGHP
jgi:hypothetical protein